MALPKIVLPALCLFAGVAIGAFALPGPYVYGEVKGAHYRVNRFTGVEQYSSSKGWVSEKEMIADSVDSAFGGLAGAVSGSERTTARPTSNDSPE